MANQITDNRTNLTLANATTGFTDLGGTGAGTLDTEIFIEGTGSIGYNTSNSLDGLLYDTAATQDWSNSTVYIWMNCGVAGLLATKANGGVRVRFAGPTATNFFEVRIAGSDDYPVAVSGGWVMFVVDVATARAVAITNGWTGGTPPLASAVQRVGIATITAGTMPRMVDNTWVDAIWVLNNNNPGIIIEGRSLGFTAWTSSDIFAQLGIAAGMFLPTTGGAYAINAPIQIGINDTTFHQFVDTNAVWLWDNQEFLPDSFYRISALGNAGGTTEVRFGSKTGVGNDATGAQGLTIAAASGGARWAMDFDDANLDTINLYGCSFQNFATFELDQANLEAISCLYINGTRVNAANSLQLRNTIVNANLTAGVAFMTTDDMGDIVNCSFDFSGFGHAIELTAATPTSQNNVGNQFSGYANVVNSTDAAILNSAAGDLVISSSGGSNLLTNSYRNTGGGSVDIQNNISVTLTGMRDNTEVRVLDNITGEFLDGIEDVSAGSPDDRSFTFALAASTVVDIAVFNINWILPPNNRIEDFTIPATDTSIPISQVRDRNYSNP